MKALHRILMVEDEPDIQAVARVALEAVGGFSVDMCSSGREALERVKSCAPDLILMDVMMPGLDGPSTLQQLRADPATAGYPVIFMTAKVQSHEVKRYRDIGGLGVIAKPFDPMTLADSVRTIWEQEHAGSSGSRSESAG
ncbi:MAG TPA: response regulator [Planctomycetota bacterium]|nr:response regulator [Planctomycetota bacterium]